MVEKSWLDNPVKDVSNKFKILAKQRQNSLTKPPGSLGRMEDIAIQLSAMQFTDKPAVNNVHIAVFAADHGVAEENVSAFPQVVTLEMVKNFARGGAAISVLAKTLDAKLEVINAGTVNDHEEMLSVYNQRIAPGTQNFSKRPAMSQSQLLEALNVGSESVKRAINESADLFIGGDMGIANTTSATAIACALLNESAEKLTGPGTGLDKDGVSYKASVIQKSIELHKDNMKSPVGVLQSVGGFEIAALVGAYISCAQNSLPVLVDGFISSVAALMAIKIKPQVKQWMFFSHASAEPGHAMIMQVMDVKPLLDMNMRLGEASGAAIVVPLMRMACVLHNNMATFEQASVSNKDNM
ncbi:MAG: nicotinate-nucleotide--dimethylbenzimidazole phosphoribosyltransferase [endosymbiont of Galathealinum brachiosum]|uniref:Nicotinate-nucleotide--dimethylbenzimidazole phosphoribosyltransferase n=1 Tax=endosymbiont of Galathealinum brachiosum TaxID=2200906 RepID=A0A370D9M9_9GAMM|nr:MAG: nicotinate-nucleotide--dimethylbenzimidazole phosphoribosyltransferase [endosymbiont of Galathealinum brachiosum]